MRPTLQHYSHFYTEILWGDFHYTTAASKMFFMIYLYDNIIKKTYSDLQGC